MFASQVCSSSQAAMGAVRPSGLAWFLGLAALGCACAVTPSAKAQTFTKLYTFLGPPDGAYSVAPLIRDSAGNLYGTTAYGGAISSCLDCGTVFELSSNGVETVLHSFRGGMADGKSPHAGLVRDAAGNLYGTTLLGGAYGQGSVFKLNAEGNEGKLLYSFTGGPDGGQPNAGLILGPGGNVYGTTTFGGTGECFLSPAGCGTVFMLSPAGVETVLYSFVGGADGEFPINGLKRDAAGNFYGTTTSGGDANCTYSGHGCGTVFKLASGGVETVLHMFANDSTDGQEPVGDIILAEGGNLYGTTEIGGTYGSGTVWEVTPTGTEKILYSFGGYAGDGRFPTAGLVADGGSFYGMTSEGGAASCLAINGCGTIFKITKAGVETVEYSLVGATDGCAPVAELISDGSGNLYGTTPFCAGTVFKFTP